MNDNLYFTGSFESLEQNSSKYSLFTQWRFSPKLKQLECARIVEHSFPRPLPPHTSTLNPPSATKIDNIIGRSMEQLVVNF